LAVFLEAAFAANGRMAKMKVKAKARFVMKSPLAASPL
jgi:hypothetical protein